MIAQRFPGQDIGTSWLTYLDKQEVNLSTVDVDVLGGTRMFFSG